MAKIICRLFSAKDQGELTISTSTGTSRRVTQGIRTLENMSIVMEELEDSVQNCHEHGKPELLCAEQGMGVCPPFSSFDVVGIS
jgi:hypothetical protein